MSGSTAKKIRKFLGYDKKNANSVQKRLYKKIKKRYNGAGYSEWKNITQQFNYE